MRTQLLGRLQQATARKAGIGGKQHGGLAAEILHVEHRRVMEIRRRFTGDMLNHVEGHHLAGDLGETLHAPGNRDQTVVIDIDDVAGVVPAFADRGLRRLDHPWILVAVIAQHQVGPAYMQHAAAVDAVHRFDAVFDAGQESAHRAAAVGGGRGQRNHRRALGRAVTLHDAHAEFFHPHSRNFRGELFPAGNHVAQSAEIHRVGIACIKRQEGAGPVKNGAVAFVGDFGNRPVAQWRDEQVHARAGDQR